MARILLVDEPDELTPTMQVLQEEGHFCQGASCGEEALRCLMGRRPDLVVLNPHLDKCEGIRTLESIKEFDADLCVMLYTRASLFGDSFDYFLADGTIARQPDHSQLLTFVQTKFKQPSTHPKVFFHEVFF